MKVTLKTKRMLLKRSNVPEEGLSYEDEIENAPDLSATTNATTPITSNRDQSRVSLNPSIADRTTVEDTANEETKWIFKSYGSEERGRRATHNVHLEQSGLSRRSRQISDLLLGAFQLLLESHNLPYTKLY